jgi:uncharacterized protein (TIGR02147 family)
MLIDYLNKELEKRQKKNKSYSRRAFAASLAMDPSTLIKILSGKRKITFSMAKKIVETLPIEESLRKILLLSYADSNKEYRIEEHDYFVPDPSLSATLMSKWEYYAILSYLEIDNTYNIAAIADALNTDEDTVALIVENLVKLEVVHVQDEKLILSGKRLTAPAAFNREALINVHKENIQKSIDALERLTKEERDISGMTFAMSFSKYTEAIEMIKTFRRSFEAFLVAPENEADSVYRLNIQFFPLTQSKKNNS